MKTKMLLTCAVASVALASPAVAERGADGELRILSWQAPSNPNPYLAGGVCRYTRSVACSGTIGAFR